MNSHHDRVRAPATYPDEPEPDRSLSLNVGAWVSHVGCPTGAHVYLPAAQTSTLGNCWCGHRLVPFTVVTTTAAVVLGTGEHVGPSSPISWRLT